MLPMTVRPYQILDTEFLVTDDIVRYNSFYMFYFDEIGNAEIGDMVATVWFNITVAKYILIGIYFGDNILVDSVGVMSHDNEELLINFRDISLETKDLVFQMEVNTIGKHSCSVFFNGNNNTFISISVYYLS